MTPKLAFLLGAGNSIPCEAPSTAELTNEVLEADTRYFRHTDGSYYRRSPGAYYHHPQDIPSVARLVDLLHALRKRVAHFYANRPNPQGCVERHPSYEDFAYLAVQMYETLSGDRDNPGLVPFAKELCAELNVDESALKQIASEAVALINDHVNARLRSLHPKADHCECIFSAITNGESSFLPILTLNHDLLVEQAFEARGVSLARGMKVFADGRMVVTSKFPKRGAALYKLHGSIDWFRWRKSSRRSSLLPREWVGTFVDEAQERSATRKWRRIEERPLILIGRFNKELSYLGEPYIQMLSQAIGALETVSVLVVSGYGFGDKAINGVLIEWLSRPAKRRRQIVVAHEDPIMLVAGARGAIADKWEFLKETGALIEIRQFLGSITWKEIQPLLDT